MGDPRGFLKLRRARHEGRPIDERLLDSREVDVVLPEGELRAQASRCMDCGIPFCHRGCPLGNVIPDFNDEVFSGRWDEAAATLESTNNFPEITGRVCPAPCEASCVLNIDGAPVTIKEVERAIAAKQAEKPLLARVAAPTGKRVAVIGSGPAGLAAAQQLARRGHAVTVFERSDRVGGLLRYGIPDFKLEKGVLDRRIDQMSREGVTFKTNSDVGVSFSASVLKQQHDAVVVAVGAEQPRLLDVPGSSARGVHLAMAYLTQQNRLIAGDDVGARVDARGKRVIVLGGGDTGSDCLGTALRQGAAEVTQIELLPAPPEARDRTNPWPEWPLIFRTSSSQEEGGSREFAWRTTEVKTQNGAIVGLAMTRVKRENGQLVEVRGEARVVPCDLLLLALGFTGVAASPLFEQLGVRLGPRGTLLAEGARTSQPSVFAAGDAVRGASLVVWAIAEGRRAAAACDDYLRAQPAQRVSVS